MVNPPRRPVWFRCRPATSHARQSLQEINFRYFELTAVPHEANTHPPHDRWLMGVVCVGDIGSRRDKHDSRIIAQRLDGNGFDGALAAYLRVLRLLDHEG